MISELTDAERSERSGDLMLLIRRIEGRVAVLTNAGRYVDAADLSAARAYLEDFHEELTEVDSGPALDDSTRPGAAPPPPPPVVAPKHRHGYDAAGVCSLLVDGKVCGAVSRAAKKAASGRPPVPPAPPAEGSSS